MSEYKTTAPFPVAAPLHEFRIISFDSKITGKYRYIRMKRGGCNSFREPTTVQFIYKSGSRHVSIPHITAASPFLSSTLIRLHFPIISLLLIPSRLDCFPRVVGLTPHLCCRLHCLPTGDQHNLLLIYLLTAPLPLTRGSKKRHVKPAPIDGTSFRLVPSLPPFPPCLESILSRIHPHLYGHNRN